MSYRNDDLFENIWQMNNNRNRCPDNCPRGKLPPGKLPPGSLPPGSLLPGQLPPRIIAPKDLFFIECYNKPLRLDVSGKRGGLLVFTKSHLPTRQLTKLKIPMDIQIIIFKLNLRKEKWLVVSVYKPPAQDATYFLNWL